MQHPNFEIIAQHPAVQKLYAAHAPNTACTAKSVQGLAQKNIPFRTALTLLMTSEAQKQQITKAHQVSCDEFDKILREREALEQQLDEANLLAEKVNRFGEHFNNTGKDAKKEKSDFQKAADIFTNLINGVNNVYINPEEAKAKEEAETKRENESNTWIWVGVGALCLLLGGLWYMSSNKKTA